MAIMACRGRGGRSTVAAGGLRVPWRTTLEPQGLRENGEARVRGGVGEHADSKKKLSLGSNIVIKICITCQI